MSALSQSVTMAFEDVPYPGDDDLTVYDQAGREFDETWRLLNGIRWQDFPVEEFIRGDTPIPDLTPAAFHYYMPALLIAALNGNDDVGQSLAFCLSPSSALNSEGPSYTHYDDRKGFRARLAMFSSRQREVMIEVLQALVALWQGDEAAAEAIATLRCGVESDWP